VANIAQRSFAGGEIAPALFGRTDLAKYATGLRKCRNMIVRREGGATSRPGTQMAVETKDSSVKSRLIEFIFSSSQTYILEFGNLYIRFITGGGQINVSGVAAWSAVTNYIQGDLASQGGVNYYAIAASLNQVPPNATYWAPLVGTVFEIPSPYLTAELPDIQVTQVADVMTIVCPGHAVRELKRFGNTRWTLTVSVFAPTVTMPTLPNPVLSGGGAGPTVWWAITAVAAETFEESFELDSVQTSTKVPSVATPTTISWTASSDAVEGYRIYRSTDSTSWGLVGTSRVPSFTDTNFTPDFLQTPPKARDPFANATTPESSTLKHPAVVGFFQQRKGFAQGGDAPETNWFSQAGHYNNFGTSFPIQDDDAITFTLAGRRINTVRHLIDAEQLLIFTQDGVWVAADETAPFTPTTVRMVQRAYYGANKVSPVLVGNNPIYVESRGSMVLDYKNTPNQGYQGKDLTIFSSHLFDGLTITDLGYQRNPNSVVWGIRSDGVLLGLTYLPEQDVWGWHRHDTDGSFEDLAVVPEGVEDKVYVIAKRTINGVTKRYIEFLTNRFFSDIKDVILMDAALTYDGRNVGATTMTLSGGVTWLYDEDLTLTSSVAFFAGGDVGNQIVMQEISAAGKVLNEIRLTIIAFTDNQHVTVNSSKTVPVNLRNSARTTWSKAVSGFGGLSHLEGKNVSILADGFVKASPNNAAQPIATVIGGVVTIDKPASVVHVGLPFLSDVETLDLDTPAGASRKSEKVNVNRVLYTVEKTRGVWVGMDPPTDDSVDPLEGLSEAQTSSTEDADALPPLITDTLEVGIESNYNNNGRVFFREPDPLPFTLLAAIPGGYI
jgi:hypothetical protein